MAFTTVLQIEATVGIHLPSNTMIGVESRGILVESIEEVIDIVSKHDPTILNAKGRENMLLYSIKYIGTRTGIPWMGVGSTVDDEDGNFSFLVMAWEVYGYRKSTRSQEEELSKIFLGRPVQDVIARVD